MCVSGFNSEQKLGVVSRHYHFTLLKYFIYGKPNTSLKSNIISAMELCFKTIHACLFEY